MEANELRKELKRISDLPLAQHGAAINELGLRTALKCTLQQLAPTNEKYGFNCHAFSLKLHDYPLMLLERNKENFFGERGPIKHWLHFIVLARRFMRVLEPADVLDDDIIAYVKEEVVNLSDLRIKHTGRMYNGVVVSKWGAKGHVWKHNIGHVPSSYEGLGGDIHIMYFRVDFYAIKKYLEAFFEKH